MPPAGPFHAVAVGQARPSVSPPSPLLLHQFFERACDAAPGALAVIAGTERLTYAALEARANRLAHYLASRGIRPGDTVGILLERSVDTYVALLAVLKAGAVFVPVDAAFPADRVAFIAHDAALSGLLTTRAFRDAAAGISCPVWELDVLNGFQDMPDTRPAAAEDDAALCYIIYTSGTTGRPKGVAVTQANICNFLRVAAPIYGVTASDRVYQGMTIAFDFSIEEIWPAFAAGATLVAGPNDTRRFGSGLAEFLIERKITVMCAVPTLLATLDRDIPSLRLLLAGGETCPRELVERWSRPGRRLLNTYGPTEATVTATWTELAPASPVTIGRPLPGCQIHLLDQSLRTVTPGEPGEICIGGPGVARGYVNRPDLTAARFIEFHGARLYRTGDLGRLTPGGEIEYLGRIDDQVKIRGYRVELAEIEALLLEDAAVENAAVAIVPDTQDLAAYVGLRANGVAVEGLRDRLYEMLRLRLPAYMVPAFIEVLSFIPRLASGKTDRSRLPAPALPRMGARPGARIPPATPLERELAAVWESVFGCTDVSVEADFFLELGGHSLFAAKVISKLRENPRLRRLGVAELYRHPTIRGLAGHIESTAKPGGETATPLGHQRHSSRRVWGCGAAQLAMLYALMGWFTAPVALLIGRSRHQPSLTWWVVLSLGLFLSGLALPIAAKWLLIGRFRTGSYPLWGWYFCRWWLARKIVEMAPVGYLAGSPLMPVYARLLGARIGKGCHIGTPWLHLADMIEIGDGASIGYEVELHPFVVEGGRLHVAPISIGAGAFLGVKSVVMPGGRIGRGARVAEQSLVARDQAIPDGESWAGSPAQPSAPDPQLAEMEAAPRQDLACPAWLWAGYLLGFLLLECLTTAMTVPGGLVVFYAFSIYGLRGGLAATPLAGLVFVITVCAVVAFGKKVLMPRARPGIYRLRSGFGLRKWMADNLMATSLGLTNTLYGTLYTLPWLRLLGTRVGPRAEVSTVSSIDPDLLTLGEESFIADMASIGAAAFHKGYIALARTEVGVRTFVGNSSVVRGNMKLAPNSLIGVQSVPPNGPVEAGTSWLGSPAIFLPRRQMSEGFDESVTFHPHPSLVACRLAIEFLRVTLPAALFNLSGLLYVVSVYWLSARIPEWLLLPAAPALYFGDALLVTSIVVALKWTIVGSYRPRVVPNWCWFVWRTELITGLYESAAVPALAGLMAGTPFMGPLLRAFGSKIGKRTYIETTYLTEFDLVSIGDDAAIGMETSLQTHLFEDRVMKMSRLAIGPESSVGPRSVVLYDSILERGGTLGALSLVMKGETMPPECRWHGIPARPME